MVKALSVQHCPLLNLSGRHLGLVKEEDGPPTNFQTVGGAIVVKTDDKVISSLREIFMHTIENN